MSDDLLTNRIIHCIIVKSGYALISESMHIAAKLFTIGESQPMSAPAKEKTQAQIDAEARKKERDAAKKKLRASIKVQMKPADLRTEEEKKANEPIFSDENNGAAYTVPAKATAAIDGVNKVVTDLQAAVRTLMEAEEDVAIVYGAVIPGLGKNPDYKLLRKNKTKVSKAANGIATAMTALTSAQQLLSENAQVTLKARDELRVRREAAKNKQETTARGGGRGAGRPKASGE